MKLNIATLSHALDLAAQIVKSGAHTQPILGHLHFAPDAQGDWYIRATDMEGFIKIRLPLDDDLVPSEPQAPFTLPADKLRALVKNLPKDQPLHLQPGAERTFVLRSGRTRAVLHGLHPDDFPVLDDDGAPLHSLPFNGAELKQALRAVNSHQAQGDVRSYLNGTHMHFSRRGLEVVATDGHRLAYIPLAYEWTADDEHSLVIARDRAANLIHLLPDDDITLDLYPLRLSVDLPSVGLHYHAKLIDGRYPDYHRVIPKNYTDAIEIDRDALLAAVRRVGALGGKSTAGVFYVTGGTITLSLKDTQEGSVEETLDCTPVEGAMDLRIGLSLPYLADVLKAIDTPSIHLRARDPESAILIHPAPKSDMPDHYVIMPMRL